MADTQLVTWRQRVIIVVWCVGIAMGVIYIAWRLLPRAVPPLPDGWAMWPQPGTTRGLVLTEEGVLAGGTQGLFRLNDDGTATRLSIPQIRVLTVFALMVDQNGTLWVGHDHGLSSRTDSQWTTLSEADGLPHNWVVALAAARDGSVWAGTPEGAVHLPAPGRWDRTRMEVLTTQDGLLHDTVVSILEDRDGGVWFGHYAAPNGGLSRLTDEGWQHWTLSDGLPHPNVGALMQASDGRVWAGCGLHKKGGVAVFGDGSDEWRLERTIPTDELTGPKTSSIYQDREGRIWLGSELDGLTIRDGGETLTMLTPNEGFPSREVIAMAQTEEGDMWLGTLAGAVRIPTDALKALFAENP